MLFEPCSAPLTENPYNQSDSLNTTPLDSASANTATKTDTLMYGIKHSSRPFPNSFYEYEQKKSSLHSLYPKIVATLNAPQIGIETLLHIFPPQDLTIQIRDQFKNRHLPNKNNEIPISKPLPGANRNIRQYI